MTLLITQGFTQQMVPEERLKDLILMLPVLQVFTEPRLRYVLYQRK